MKLNTSPNYRWYIFAMCGSTYVISGFWRVSNAVIAGDLTRDLTLSAEVLGLVGGAPAADGCRQMLTETSLEKKFPNRPNS